MLARSVRMFVLQADVADLTSQRSEVRAGARQCPGPAGGWSGGMGCAEVWARWRSTGVLVAMLCSGI